MTKAPKLTRMQVDGIRDGVERFIKQEGSETTLMPFSTKRLLIMLDTIDELYDQEAAHGQSIYRG